ncbi:hypothetical protein AB0L00_19765 [Actinoallomurus sp. NPDC052308]|uniref:hypothetical protein n=1 Tax=Actinoallomurus sp. NPDC052308 TaxID=3155530 RepID=UPI003431DB15
MACVMQSHRGRNRYLAIFELQLEATRRPVLASALTGLQDTAVQITAGHHDKLGLTTARATIPTLITFYTSALFTLVTSPPASVSRAVVQDMVQVIVHGCGVHDEDPGLGSTGKAVTGENDHGRPALGVQDSRH